MLSEEYSPDVTFDVVRRDRCEFCRFQMVIPKENAQHRSKNE